MSSLAEDLAVWATGSNPGEDDLALAERSLRDTVAVMLAAREHEFCPLFERLSPAGHWAAQAHVLDYDDLHLPSTAHISAVCIPVALLSGGGARAYLAGAGVMARLGTALGWSHYRAGWHATCTVGAPAAAVAAGVALGLDAEELAAAIALAVPGAGGVQAGFGTAAKSLQVGFAVDAGVRAARLVSAGATADPRALESWVSLVIGADVAPVAAAPGDPGAVSDGLAIKLYPCCYALQRPVHAMRSLREDELSAANVQRISVSTPASSLQPLIHHRPVTGLQGKFSLEYGLVAALLDGRPGLNSFTDDAVQRPEAQQLMERVAVNPREGGVGLLAGEVTLSVTLRDGGRRRTSLDLPPGAPSRPPTEAELREKLEACAGEIADQVQAVTFETAAGLLA
ncbi:MAG: MmgE/PrpD family protein [Solirubrobacteraceae bacterium]